MLIAQSLLLLERYLLAFEEASMACITSINISARKGVRKTPVGDAPQVVLVDDGLENDAHAGKRHRQVSFLAEASLAKARDMGLEVGPGDFAETLQLGESICLICLWVRNSVWEKTCWWKSARSVKCAIPVVPFTIWRAIASSPARAFSGWCCMVVLFRLVTPLRW